MKVQRPSVSLFVRKDLRVMAWLAPHLVGRIPIAALGIPADLATYLPDLPDRLAWSHVVIARAGAGTRCWNRPPTQNVTPGRDSS